MCVCVFECYRIILVVGEASKAVTCLPMWLLKEINGQADDDDDEECV